MKLERLIITCGGTGGHFYPGLSIARKFSGNGGNVLLLLSGVNSVSQAEIAASYGIKAVVLPNMPSPLRSPLRFMAGLTGGFFKSLKIIRDFKTQAVLGMGSFAQMPIILAALFCRVPRFLHDGNVVIGRANRKFSRFSRLLGAGFPPVNGDLCRCKIRHTGMPVRQELLQYRDITKSEAVAALNANFGTSFSDDLPVILIFGGSQGAAIFNAGLPAALKKISGNFQVLHLCGKGKKADAAAAYEGCDFPLLLLETHGRMEWFLGAADLIFCRSGGSTLAEIALFGKAALLVPYPAASEDHQRFNAEYFCANQAAEMILNKNFTADAAAEVIKSFIASPDEWKKRAENAAKLARPEAAEEILKEISADLD